ncbi:MAG: DUF2974 domain-containing protein [Lachnospiraceae bacterium]|nr:DUF2974 domain-containing protein [Lachnospiraceae bacterium]
MASLSDYLLWRGDITFEEVPLNAVDALLLSQVSYLDLKGIIGDREERQECTLAQASKRYWELHTQEELENCVSFALRTVGNLLREMAQTKRFSSLLLRNYVSRIDMDAEEQFAAVEVVLGKRESYISYSGTDDSLVGWKEDFNMCFLSPVPAQTDALAYLEQILESGRKRVYVGGHSKGGNLAVYAAVKCKKLFGRSILRVYNFDGPGFKRTFIESLRYQEMKDKIETWVPDSSVVGMLLEHEEDYQVVKSKHVGIMQHDVTSWEVMGSGFIRLPEVKLSSRRMAAGVKEWMSGLKPEELEFFFDCIYEVLTATQAKTLADLNKDKWKSVTSIVRSYNTMDKKAKEMLLALIKIMIGNNLKIELPLKITEKRETKEKKETKGLEIKEKELSHGRD